MQQSVVYKKPANKRLSEAEKSRKEADAQGDREPAQIWTDENFQPAVFTQPATGSEVGGISSRRSCPASPRIDVLAPNVKLAFYLAASVTRLVVVSLLRKINLRDCKVSPSKTSNDDPAP